MKDFKEYKKESDWRKADARRGMADVLEGLLGLPALHVSGPDGGRAWQLREGSDELARVRAMMQGKLDECRDPETDIPLFTEFQGMREPGGYIGYLTESENAEVDRWVDIWENDFGGDLMDEGFLSKLVGGAAGFIVGPAVGKVIARALGVEKGAQYDLFTSRLVSAAIGAAIAKAFGGEYKE